jgi:hypothetical protein
VAAVAYLPEDVQRSTRSLIRELGHLLDRQHEGSALRVRELRREPAETAALLHGAALGGSTMAHGLDLELPDATPPAALSATPPLSRPPADPVATPASASETVTATSTTSARQTMAMLAHVVAPRETDTPAA